MGFSQCFKYIFTRYIPKMCGILKCESLLSYIVSRNSHFNFFFLFNLFLAKLNKVFLSFSIQRYPKGKWYGRCTVCLHIQLGIWHIILRTAVYTHRKLEKIKTGQTKYKKMDMVYFNRIILLTE